MKRISVDSSAILEVGYDEETYMLEVQFTGGAVYRYEQVPTTFYRLLLRAESKGKFVNEYIANNNFPYRRIR